MKVIFAILYDYFRPDDYSPGSRFFGRTSDTFAISMWARNVSDVN
jgi:hypothetical protein